MKNEKENLEEILIGMKSGIGKYEKLLSKLQSTVATSKSMGLSILTYNLDKMVSEVEDELANIEIARDDLKYFSNWKKAGIKN